MSSLSIACPSCAKSFSVPTEAVGKRVRCKSCSHVFTVPDEGGEPKPASAKPAVAKPAAAKPIPSEFQKAQPAKAKPAEPPKDEPKPADAPLKFMDDDEDEDPNAKYTVDTSDDDGIARCPRCADELDPPDATICLNCGFDLVKRVRHSTKKIYAQTGSDVFLYWLPAIIWIIVLAIMLGIAIYCWIMMGTLFETTDWIKDTLKSDDKNELTGKQKYIVAPECFNVCCSVIFLFLAGWGVPVIYKRIKKPKPEEVEKKK